MERHRELPDVVLNPERKPRRTALPSDVQKVIVVKEEQQDWSPSLDQDPEPPHIKEEQEDLWTGQEGEQLRGLEEADITEFPFAPVPVKSEEDEEKPQSSQLHQSQTEQMETGADGEDCGGPGPARNSDPDTRLQPETEDKTGDSSETEDSDDGWKETRDPQSGLNSLKNKETAVSDVRCKTGEKPFSCYECGKIFDCKGSLKRHLKVHTGEKPFSCSVCGKRFTHRANMNQHMAVHTGEKRYSCSVCDKRFTWSTQVKTHRCVDESSQLNEVKSFSCSECSKTFGRNTNLKAHMRIHTGEKPFSCPVCDERFTWHHQLQTHKCVGRRSSQLHQNQTEDSREAEPPASSSAGQMETGADGEDCGGPGPARNSDPDTHLQQDTDDKTEDSDDWEETREPQSGLNSVKNYEVPVSDMRCNIAEKPFSCSECGKRFCHKDYLKRHVRIHTGEKPFNCSFCGERFLRRTTLISHTSLHTGEKPFSCSVCKKHFSYRGSVWSQMRIHAWQKRFNSNISDTKLINTHSGAESAKSVHHLQPHTDDKTEDCHKHVTGVSVDDGKESRDPQSALTSLKNDEVPVSDMTCKTAEKPFSCSECGKRFGRKTHLKSHMRIHTGEKPFGCSVCGKRFSHRANMNQHMSAHTGEKRYSCSVCDKRFTWSTQLKHHQCVGRQSSQLHQAEPPASSSAEQMKTEADGEDCGGPGPARNSDPDTHLQSETEDKTEDSSERNVSDGDEETREPQSGLITCNNAEKPISCSECGKRFGHRGNLSRHMRIHTGEKPFSCSVCGRGFADKATLTKHMRTHTGEKPFSCLVCGKRFKHRVSLKQHMAQHAREKQVSCVGESSQLIEVETFTCSKCEKTFGRKDTLQEHMRTHTGEKPFSCSECSKTFGRKSNLKAHMRIHTGEKRFSCSVCHQRFTWHHQLKNHQCFVHSADCGGSKPARNRVLMPRPRSDELIVFVYL